MTRGSQWRDCRSYDSGSESDSSDRSDGGQVDRWPCNKCDKDYATKSNLMRHVNTAHTRQSNAVASRETDRYPCTICGKDYATQGNLNRHIQTIHGTSNGASRVTNVAVYRKSEMTQKNKTTYNINIYNPIINNIYNLRLKD